MQDLTTGSITRHLVKTMGFMLLMMVFQTLYVLVDLYWVGRLGTASVAAVGISGNLMFVVLALTQMLAVGTTTVVAHAMGRKDRDAARLGFNQSLSLSLLCSVLFLGVALALRTRYATAQSADAETATQAARYLLWFIPAMALQFPLVAMSAALRGAGNFKLGVAVGITTVVTPAATPSLKLPAPRSAADIATNGNWSAIAGMNHSRYSAASSAVRASALMARA